MKHQLKAALSVLMIIALVLGCIALTSCGEDKKGMEFITIDELKDSDKEEYQEIYENLVYFNTENGPDFWVQPGEVRRASLDDDGYVCILNSDAKGEVTVPDEYKDESVVFVTAKDGALDNITSLTIPDSVKYIENIGGGEDDENSSLTSVSLPDGIHVYHCFQSCSELASVDCKKPKEIVSAFNNAPALDKLSIADAEKIANSFADCTALESLDLSGIELVYESFNGSKKLTSLNLTDVDDVCDCFTDCDAMTSVDLSDVGELSGSFDSCDVLTSLDLTGLAAVSDSFHECVSLTSVSLPDAETIETSFGKCSSLKSVSIPKAKKVEYSFVVCEQLTEIKNADNVETIHSSFDKCTKLVPPKMDNLFEIRYSFNNCDAITDTEFAKTAYTFENSFCNCPALEKVNLDKAGFVSDSFCSCYALKTIRFGRPEGMNIYGSANHLKKLESVTVSGPIDIMNDSFNDCPELKTFEYSGLEEYEDCFDKCPKLKTKILTDEEIEKRKKEEEEKKRQEELDNEPYGPGTSALELSAEDDMSACFRLLRMNGSEEFMVFLEPGESTTEYFPSGRYVLKVAEGKKWISDEEAFGNAGHYSKTEVYTFEPDYAYSITTGDHGDFRSDSASGFVD